MWKRAAFYGLLVLIPLACAEIGSFVVARTRPDLFDHRDEIFRKFRPEDFQRYKSTVASNLLGWDNPAGVRRLASCGGEQVTYSYDAARVRRHGDRSPQNAVVVVAGDSYTQGDDAADDDTYPAALEKIFDVGVANLGVGGYGPEQALLKLESLIDRFPHARVAVLSILSDDTRRMMNSFRPVLNRETGILFGFKPYLRDGVFQDLVGGDPLRDFDTMRSAAETAFDTDFWRRPRARFPYLIAVSQLFYLPSFWVPLLTQAQSLPPYEAVHRLASVRGNLRALFDRFEAFTRSRGLAGVVAFIPVSESDQGTGAVALSAASAAQHQALTFVDVTIKDWSEFFAGPGCHPSAKGYAAIAADVANAVRPLLDRRTRADAPR
jgi:GDSL-like Lipase/Acylhydrolase family